MIKVIVSATGNQFGRLAYFQRNNRQSLVHHYSWISNYILKDLHYRYFLKIRNSMEWETKQRVRLKPLSFAQYGVLTWWINVAKGTMGPMVANKQNQQFMRCLIQLCSSNLPWSQSTNLHVVQGAIGQMAHPLTPEFHFLLVFARKSNSTNGTEKIICV